MATLTNIYSDLDLRFSSQPGTGDVSLLLDNRAVITSVRNLLLTNFYERPWQPGLGSSMNNQLFENINVLMESTLAQEIQNVIKNFEPRVTVQNIKVTAQPEQNGYAVSMSFFIGNNTQATQISVFLERTR
jgi:hypothetical protein